MKIASVSYIISLKIVIGTEQIGSDDQKYMTRNILWQLYLVGFGGTTLALASNRMARKVYF